MGIPSKRACIYKYYYEIYYNIKIKLKSGECMEKGKDFLLRSNGKRHTMVPIRLFDKPENMKVFSSQLGWRIFQKFSEPSCPIDVARELGVHEQKVYYYINKFKNAKLIKEVKSEPRHGTIAKFYQIKDFAFGLRLDNIPAETELKIHSPVHVKSLEPFIVDGNLNAKIIVGSPDPHGPWKARASDSCCAIDFALFIGAFTRGKQVPNYKLDTEVREKDLKGNLILFGGPTVNMVTRKINKELPIFFEMKRDLRRIRSELSGKIYSDDECGLIEIADNPWDKKGKVLILAGKRFHGTRSAVLAWVKYMEKIMKGNKFNPKVIAKVVRGYDMNGDGIIDDVEILE